MASLRIALAFLALPLVACGGRVDISPEADGGVDGGADTGLDVGTDGGSTCTPAECGPAPGVPSRLCWDGSTSGFTCGRNPAGTCGWLFRDCPPEKACNGTPGECGAALYCKRAVGVCSGDGKCAGKPEACDLLYAPVCGCDGKTYGNACAAEMDGMNVSYAGECRATRTCSTSKECAPTEFCKQPDGTCGATMPPKPTGACTTRPAACPDKWDPVCGCDGTTYSNACDAASAGVNVSYKGSCPVPPPVKICGGFGGFLCSATEWCDYPVGDMCGAADGTGECKSRPVGCTKEYAPVCGCDGRTYTNACMAHAAGQDDLSAGPCK